VLVLILDGVGGKYCKIAEVEVVPNTLQALIPFALILPPVNPVLNCSVTLELSEVAAVITVFAGMVHLYLAIGVCVLVGTEGTAVKVIGVPIQTVKLPPTVVIAATVAGVVLENKIAVLATLIEQGVTDLTDSVSLIKHDANVTITAVSLIPKGFR